MLSRISPIELNDLARKCGLAIQHDCGGYRVVTLDNSYVFPNSGICPTVTKRDCWHFLLGYATGRKSNHQQRQHVETQGTSKDQSVQ